MARVIPCKSASGLLLALVLLFPLEGLASVNVVIEGLEGDALRNVEAHLQIRRLADDDTVAADQVRRLHRRAPDQIREALEPLGYYQARVVEAELASGQHGWTARYVVEPGDPVLLTEVSLQLRGDGEDDPAFARVLTTVALVPGEPANHARYDEARNRLLDVASRRGYFEAEWIERRLEVDPAAGEARVLLHLDTGPRYTFGELHFDQDQFDEAFLRRYARFRSGDPFDRRLLLDLQYALSDSDYFRTVDVSAERGEAVDRAVPVVVRSEPALPNRYSWGVGYGTDTGARTRLRWQRRYLNRSGHYMESSLELAEIRQRFNTAYTIPLAEPWRERFVLSLDARREQMGDGRARTLETGGKRIVVDGRWQRTESLFYERSRDTLSGTSRTIELIVPGYGVETRRFDDSIYPRRGYQFGATVRGASESLGSDLNFSRLRLAAGWVRGLTSRTRILTRAEWGVVEVSEFDDLPLSHRFFAGGDHSVRGFAYQSLGPQNEDGDVIGGRYLTTASVELEQLLRGNWGAAVFYDTGNTGNEASMRLEDAAGVGARWRSPVGMFKLDVAQPLSTDDDWRLHLSFGMNL